MKSIRIGNDIRIEWPLEFAEGELSLQNLRLSVEVQPSRRIVVNDGYADGGCVLLPQPGLRMETVMTNEGYGVRPHPNPIVERQPCEPRHGHKEPPCGCRERLGAVQLPFTVEGGKVVALWTADRQFAVGDYDIRLYSRKNEAGQAVVDQYRFVRLVPHTAMADLPADSDVEAVVAMQPVKLSLGGLSAYDIAVLHGFTGTEEEWLDSLKNPAEYAERIEAILEKALGLIDDHLSDESENAVQNKAITQALNGKQDRLTEGEGITISDDNVISAKVTATVEVDEELSSESENPVQNKAIKAKLDSMDTSIGDNADDIKTLWAKVFPLTLTVTGGGVYEKGTSQTVIVNWVVKEGDTITFPDTVTVNGSSVLATGQSKRFSSVTTDATYTVAITKGGVSKTGSVKAQFVNPSYFGVVDSDFETTEEGIKALNKKIIKAVKTYNTDAFSQNAQKSCYAYPKTFGALTSITDGKNEFIGSYTRSEVTVNSETYYVYLLTDPSTVTDYKLQFK